MSGLEKSKKHHVFLIGFMGTGKSTVASEFGKLCGMQTLEMDQAIVCQQHMEISEIFQRYGEEYFRDLESDLLVKLEQREPLVVSCGGGVVVRPENIHHMKEQGCIVLLTASPETVLKRVKKDDSRPILQGHMDQEYIAQLMEKRRVLYQRAADVTIQTDEKTPREIGKEMKARLLELGLK